MAKLFDYNNPIWKIMGKVADVFLLSLLWILFSLPVVTMGASSCGLYYVSLKLAENKEGYLFRTFVKGFKEGFVQSTVIWGIMAVIGGFVGTYIYRCQASGTEGALTLLWALLILAVFYLLIMTVVFALAARLSTSIFNLFMMSFMVCVNHLPWVFFMAVITICVTALGIFVFWPLLLFAPGAIAFAHAKILIHMIFPKYNWNLDAEERKESWQC